MTKELHSTWGKAVSLVAALCIILFAAIPAHAAIYAPGATLDPACAPTDANCGVETPISVSSEVASAPSFSATSTTATSTFSGAVDASSVKVGTLNGFLQAVSGYITAISSLTWDSVNGRLGVGTTTPSQKLEVQGNVKISGSGNGLMFADGTTMTTAASSASGVASTTDVNIAADTDTNGSGAVFFATNGTNRMTLANSGNLGVGTTSPDDMLAIQGNGVANLFEMYSQAGLSRFIVKDNGQVGIGTESFTNGAFAVGTTSSFSATSTFASGVTVSGNASLATTTVTGLTIAGQLRDTNTATGTVGQVLQAQADGTVQWGSVAGTVADGTATSSTLRWNGSAWVENTGFTSDGTTATTTNFVVTGNTVLADATSTNAFATNQSATNFVATNATTTNLTNTATTTTTGLVATLADIVTGIFTNLTASIANITTATIATLTGNTATIGTLTATSTADVKTLTASSTAVSGTLAVTGTTTLATTTATGLTLSQNGLTLASSTPAATSSTLYALGSSLYWDGSAMQTALSGTEGQSLVFNSAGNAVATSSLFVANSGNVGIGNTSPGMLLTLGGSSVDGQAILKPSSAQTDYTAVQHSAGTAYSGALNVITGSGDTKGGIHIGQYGSDSQNSFGIITQRTPNSVWASSPTALTDGRWLSGLAFAGQSNTSLGSGMTVGAAINGKVDGTVSSGVLPTSLVFLTSPTNASGLVERMRINANGNVGIGTTSPIAKLAVTGDTYFTATTTLAGALNLSAITGGLLTTNGSGAVSTTSLASLVGGTEGQAITFSSTGDLTATSSLFIDASGNVGIGTTTPNNKLHVANLIEFNDTDFVTKIGKNAGRNIVSGAAYNTLIGYEAGLSSASLSTNAADYNTAIGYRSLYSNTTGAYNTAVGMEAFRSNTSGSYDTAIGYRSLYSNTTGAYNTANGFESLNSNTTGGFNTALGYRSLHSNISGFSNVATGFESLYGNTTGVSNVAIGYGAGRYIANGSTANTTGDYNLFIGEGTKALADNDQNEIVIGYNAIGNGSNSVTLGNTSITKTLLQGNVGIGTTTPSYKLAVAGDSYFTATSTFAKGINIASSTPDSTTNALYNLGSTLYWNGSAVGGANATGTAGLLQFTDGNGVLTASSLLSFATSTGTFSVTGTSTLATTTASYLAVSGNTTLATTTVTGITASTNGLTLASSTPLSTSNTLYNLGSTLYWNGNALASSSAGQTVEYMSATKNSAQTVNPSVATDVTYTKNTGSIPFNGTYATLTAGKTYEISWGIITNDGDSATTYITTSIVNASNAVIGNSRVVSIPATFGNNGASPSAGSVIYTPSTDTNVKVRVVAGGGTSVNIQGNTANYGRSWFTIKQLGSSAITSDSVVAVGGNTLGSTLTIGTLDSNALALTASSTEAMRILANGFIGIGTTTATNKLHLEGAMTIGSSTPATTTMALYNQGGTLYWNGSAVGSDIWEQVSTNIASTSNSILKLADDQMLYTASSTYGGSLFVGDGGLALAHTSGNEGYFNAGVGSGALRALTTGWGNSAFGHSALVANTSGNANTASGYLALSANTTGGGNTALGQKSMQSNTSGVSNVAIGSESFTSNTIGNLNVAIGVSSLAQNTSGSGNVALGYSAGANASSTNSLYLGRSTAHGALNADNEIVIGYNATGLGSNTLVLGNDSIVTTALKGNLGIGTSTPSRKLNVVQTTANTPAARLSANVSTEAVLEIETTSAGGEADIVFMENGTERGSFLNRTGDFEFWAKPGGVWTQTVEIKENGNVGIGTSTPTNKLVVSKASSGGTALSGAISVFENNTNGYLSILVPDANESGIVFANPSSDVSGSIMYNSASTANGLEFRVNSNQTKMVINSSGNVGIGTTTPGAKLHLAGNMKIDGANTLEFGAGVTKESSAGKIGYQVFTGDSLDIIGAGTTVNNRKIRFWNEGGAVFTGNVGIATTPQRTLHAYVGASLPPVRFENVNGYCEINPTSTTWTCTSDASLKTNVMTLDDTLEGILALNPVNFDWKTQASSTPGLRGERTGLIAQEVEAIFPELVTTDPETGLKSVSYGGLTIPMLKAMQEMGAIADINAATSTISESGEVTKTFVGKFLDRLVAWFADATNGITKFFAKSVETEELCVADASGAKTCITKNQLDSLLSGQAAAASAASGGSEDVATDAAPAVSISISGNNPATIEVGSTYSDLGATIDTLDQALAALGIRTYQPITESGELAEVTNVSIDTSSAGAHTITYRVVDGEGNILAEATRTVEVVAPNASDETASEDTATTTPETTEPESVPEPEPTPDTTAPIITIDSGTDTITAGDSWVDAGATATDDIDGDITAYIAVSGEVDTTTVGSYTITYTASDTSGNTATATRTITVEAAPEPELTPEPDPAPEPTPAPDPISESESDPVPATE